MQHYHVVPGLGFRFLGPQHNLQTYYRKTTNQNTTVPTWRHKYYHTHTHQPNDPFRLQVNNEFPIKPPRIKQDRTTHCHLSISIQIPNHPKTEVPKQRRNPNPSFVSQLPAASPWLIGHTKIDTKEEDDPLPSKCLLGKRWMINNDQAYLGMTWFIWTYSDWIKHDAPFKIRKDNLSYTLG